MDEALNRARELLAYWDEELRKDRPADADVFDVHVHLGDDIDGMRGDYEELERIFTRYGVSRAFVFCMDEPDRHPGFRAANDRTLAHAERAGGWIVPFVRLDLTEEPIAEAERCLDRGARGIKLHPRAQRFLLNDDRLDPVFALGAERRVPILIHGGRGLPPIADHLAHLVERYDDAQLIVAHAGIADLANLARLLSGRAGVFFDTSAWSAVDLLDFYRQVPPEQILYASDYPYGQQPNSLLIAIRTARLAGFDERELRLMLAGNAQRIADGLPPLEPGRHKGRETLTQSMPFARIHGYISMSTPLLWTGQPDAIGALGLAINTCEERDGHTTELTQIRDLLVTARELWRALPEIEDDADRRALSRETFRLIHLADILAVTAG